MIWLPHVAPSGVVRISALLAPSLFKPSTLIILNVLPTFGPNLKAGNYSLLAAKAPVFL